MVYTTSFSKPRPESESENTDLWYAAKNGNCPLLEQCSQDEEYFQEYLDKGHLFKGDIYTPLQIAIAHRETEAASFLIEQGAELDYTMGNGDTLLHMTVQYKLFGIARELLEHGANVDTRNDLGETPLYLAVWNNKLNFVELFVDHDADPNALAINDSTPLSIATRWENGEVLEKMQ